MAFPQVITTAASQQTSATTSHVVSLPSGIASGDLILVYIGFAGQQSDSGTYPGGWTKKLGSGANNTAASWGYRVATGSEGASITITTTPSCQSAHRTYRITGHDSSTNAPQSIAYWNSGTDAAPNPDGLSPTGGTKDYLWVEAAAADSGYICTGASTSFTSLVTSDSGSTANVSAAVSTARREYNGSTLNPDAMTLEAAEGWLCVVVAVHPGSEGTPPAGGEVTDPFGMSGFFGA